jgi:hypothetical protein
VRRLLKEPLFHFLLLGAAIFVAYSLVAVPGRAPGTIVVTAERVKHLEAGFERLWQRPPTDAERKGLIDDWVREEIATREALALGLDKDDPVIRRRLRQKLEFVSEDAGSAAEPTDAELEAYLRAHAGAFSEGPRVTFRQVYLDPSRHGDRLARDAAQLLARLRQNDSAATPSLGDATLLPARLDDAPATDIAKQFGETFATALVALAPGSWQGPVESTYGVHLVRVDRRSAARAPELADVKDAVRREWTNARRLEATERLYQDLLERYTVRVE